MSDQLSLTQKWLRQNIQPYSRKDIVYNHVDTILAAFSTLRPKTDVYTFDDGRSQLLLCVHGLLPITYRRASYNIPVAVWLTLEYPTQPPLAYVVPTGDMLVKAGKFVDVSGRCEPPYVQAWQKKSEGCNLRALMEALTDQFSQEPPVYAKPRKTSPPPHPRDAPVSSMTDYSSRPPPAAPGSPQNTGPSASPTPDLRQTSSRPPGLPPNPEPPNRPPTHSPPPPIVSRYSHISNQNIYHPPRFAASPSFIQQPPQWIAAPAHSYPQSPPHTHQVQPPLVAPPPPPQSVPLPQSIAPPVPPASTPNLLDEDNDIPQAAPPPKTAPPRPPNPEILQLRSQVHAKFAAEFAAFEQALAADTQRLRAAQVDLLAGEPAIRDEMARLEAVRDVCSVVASRLSATVESAETNLNDLRRKGDPEVDELICSTTIVYNQLVDLVAEDNAIEDTIYHLHRALNAGRIDLDKFLRTTRALAEEQFMKRALTQKILASIPLGAWR